MYNWTLASTDTVLWLAMTRTSQFLASVRSELNHFFTEPPFAGANGDDAGWFCREHALVTAALARILGERSELCLGNLILHIPDACTFHMIDSDANHAWCRVEEISPIDASATMKYLGAAVPDVTLVCPDLPGAMGAFRLVYLVGAEPEELIGHAQGEDPVLVYNERRVHSGDPLHLLDRPFSFLLPPPAGSPNLLQIYGPHVLHRITAHLFEFGNGRTESVQNLHPNEAIKVVCERQPTGRTIVRGTLARKD